MQKKKVYIADDDPDILEIISMILEDNGFEVETSPDGRSLQHIKNKPDVILLDIRMSGTHGGEICRDLKGSSEMRKIPVILVSANKDIKEIASNCGADDILPKPFEIVDLINMAKRYSNS